MLRIAEAALFSSIIYVAGVGPVDSQQKIFLQMFQLWDNQYRY
jgi:hypothetical protein